MIHLIILQVVKLHEINCSLRVFTSLSGDESNFVQLSQVKASTLKTCTAWLGESFLEVLGLLVN